MEFLKVRKCNVCDLEDMVSEILSQDARDQLARSGQVRVDAEFDELHSLCVYVSKGITGISIAALIRKLSLPTKESIPKELVRAISHLRGGLILLGGAYSHNKDLTIQCLLNTVCEMNKRFILTFGLYNTECQQSDNSIVSSHSSSEATLDLIRHSAADLVVFGELSPNIMVLAQDCVMMGMTVILSVDSASPSRALTRTLFMFQERETGIGFLSSYLLGIAFQVLLVTQVEDTCLYLYDFVKCDDSLLQAIKNNTISDIECRGIVEQMNKLIEENKLVYYDVQHAFANLTNSSSVHCEDTDAF
ncbi:MAG: twitching motility protein (pilT) [Aaplasma endosymbiont of Hyalomma asiaticum]